MPGARQRQAGQREMLGQPPGRIGAEEAEGDAALARLAQRHEPMRHLLEARGVDLAQRLDVVAQRLRIGEEPRIGKDDGARRDRSRARDRPAAATSSEDSCGASQPRARSPSGARARHRAASAGTAASPRSRWSGTTSCASSALKWYWPGKARRIDLAVRAPRHGDAEALARAARVSAASPNGPSRSISARSSAATASSAGK